MKKLLIWLMFFMAACGSTVFAQGTKISQLPACKAGDTLVADSDLFVIVKWDSLKTKSMLGRQLKRAFSALYILWADTPTYVATPFSVSQQISSNTIKDSSLHKFGTAYFSSTSVPTITTGLTGTSGYVWTSNGSTTAPTFQVASGGGWGLTGNSGTTVGTNFIGTTDNVSFEIKVNNTIAGLFTPAGSSNNLLLGGSAVAGSGGSNTSVGNNSDGLGTTGSGNTGVGEASLYTVTSGTNNTGMGYNAYPATGTLANTTALGYNSRPTISNSLMLGGSAVARIDANGELMGIGGIPTIAAGAGAGSGLLSPVVSDTGVGMGVNVVVTTGTTTTTGVICTLTFTTAFTNGCVPELTPANANAAIAVGAVGIYVQGSATQISIISTSVALTGGATTYVWHLTWIGF